MVGAIHGDLTQNQRLVNLNNFRSQKMKVLIATDVAQRGLDLPKVDYVLNYELPNSIEDYSHRIGRTGRGGRRGCAITLVSRDTDRKTMQELRAKLIESQQELPPWFDDMMEHLGNGKPQRGY